MESGGQQDQQTPVLAARVASVDHDAFITVFGIISVLVVVSHYYRLCLATTFSAES